MELLIIGMVLFFIVHSFPHFQRKRQQIIQRVGAIGYQGMFALLSLGGMVLIVRGMSAATFTPLWEPLPWSGMVAVLGMPLAFVLVTAAYLKNNIQRYLRHPMLSGVLVWAVVHLLANGDLASVILFAGFAVYALFDMWSANRRGTQRSTAVMPLSADVLTVSAGLIGYAVVLYFHGAIFGAPLMPG